MIRPVSYAEILDDPNWPALEIEYAAECSIPELGTPNPQRELYALLEKSGGFQAFGVYERDVLVGFAAVLIWVLPHYGTKIAATESIFITKEHRHSSHGLRGYIEQYAREKGCVAFQYIAVVGSRFDHLLSADRSARYTNDVYLVKL